MSFFQNTGTAEIIVVAIIIVLLFGGRKIPEFVRGLAEAIREFKKDSSNK